MGCVRGRKAFGDLRSGFDHLSKGQRAAAQDLAERLTLDQFHDHVVGADVVDGDDIGMIQGRGCLGFSFKSSFALLHHLQRDIPSEAGIAGTIDFSHATRANYTDDLIGAQAFVRRERHDFKSFYITLAGDSVNLGGSLEWTTRKSKWAFQAIPGSS
jgi:hypothetical protein